MYAGQEIFIMSDRPALSRAEMEVARIVWTLRDATVRQVLDNLPETRSINYKTVQTFLRRLEAKGYLVSKRDGRSLVYTADARPKQVIRDTVKNFLNNLFNGEPLPLVEHLIRDQGMSKDEIGQLRTLLDELDSGNGGK
jgi:BlaI family transcriptional regulator, penicillinase repressor